MLQDEETARTKAGCVGRCVRITRLGKQPTSKHEIARATEKAPGDGGYAQWEASCFFFLDGGGEFINDGMD